MKKIHQWKLCALLLLLPLTSALAQEHCASGLRIGAYDYFRSTVASADNTTIHNELCSTYNRYESDKQGGSAKASYKVFSGSASFSREQIEALGTMMCRSDYSDSSADKVRKHASAAISPAAMEAYSRCLELNKKGLKVEISMREDDQGAVAMTLSYLTEFDNRPKITGISVDPEEEFTCKGTLWDAASAAGADTPFLLDQARSMLCTRTIHDRPILVGTKAVMAKPASLLVETEAGAIRHHLPSIPVSPGPNELNELRKQMVPVGAFILTADKCPDEYFVDVTDQYNGRLFKVDSSVSQDPKTPNANGDHSHAQGGHTHNVTGKTATPSGGQREGSRGRHVAHARETPITGTAHSSDHSHGGGSHTHSSVNFRLCKKTAGAVLAGQ